MPPPVCVENWFSKPRLMRRLTASGQNTHRIHHRARVEMEKIDIDALRADDTGARRSSAS